MPTVTWEWVTFAALLFPLLLVDLWSQRGGRGSDRRSALLWSIIWVTVGLLFTFYVGLRWGEKEAYEYLAAYLIEKSLSLDNLFVFLLIFRTMKIPARYQRTALAWGIFGALVFRGVFVMLGVAALERWQWVEYIFGALLIYAAFRSLQEPRDEAQESPTVEWLARHLPVSKERNTARFWINEDGRLKLTPLFVTILALESTDILFAVDSVPAALSISHHPFVVFSSNAFAILGLRALYILLAGVISELRYLHYGLAAVLAFAGVKMLGRHYFTISPLASVVIIILMLSIAAIASVRARRTMAEAQSEQ